MRVGGLAQLSRRRDTDTSRCLQIMTCVLLQHALSRLSPPPTKSWSGTLLPRSYSRPHAPSATSKHLSEEGDYDCAARWGAGPWKVGVLAGLLFGFDVFVGQIDPATVAASPRLSLQREHIRRARELHGLLEHMRAAWAVNSDAFTAPEQVLLQDPEFVAGLAPGHGRLPSQMEELPQQQQQQEEEAAAADAFPADAAGNRRAVPAAWEPGQLNVIQRLWEELELEDLPAVPPHVDQENIIMMDTAVDVKTGYGAHGASVRSSVARGPDPMALRSGGHAEAPSCREARDSPRGLPPSCAATVTTRSSPKPRTSRRTRRTRSRRGRNRPRNAFQRLC